MERLKFRAWHKYQPRYLPVDVLDFVNEVIYVYELGDEGYHNNNLYNFSSVIIEQFTGLTDKNGKEIYEGDIVEVPTIDEIGNVDLDTLIYQKIVYEETMFLCKEVNQTKMASEGGGGASLMCFFVDGLNEIKVIGNIHENPELLDK